MTRTSPKLLILVAALLTAALLAFVFMGGSQRSNRPPRDRLTDEQAMTPSAPARQLPDLSAIVAGNEETAETTAPTPPPPPPEPQVEDRPVAQPRPAQRPAPPAAPKRTAKAEVRPTAAPRAPAKAEVRKTTPKPPPIARRPAPAKTANAPAPVRIVSVRPSYNCRYARTRSEVAVCGDAGLASLDRQMAAQFSTAYRQATAAQREVLERSRMRFLYRRDRCRSASCIEDVYRARMGEINDIAARNWRQP